MPDAPLDVACGTGFVTEALLRRFPGVRRVTGVDLSDEMLERFRAKLAGWPEVEVRLVRAGVTAMPVPDAGYEAVLSGMALHWFPDKPAAIAAIARAARPGGLVGVLGAGRGTDRELREVMEAVRPRLPVEWTGVFDLIHRDAEELEAMLRAAGLEPLDVWEERRVRHASPEAYMERILAVSGHLSEGNSPSALRVRVDGQGRMVLPLWLRRELVAVPGEVVLRRTADGVLLTPVATMGQIDEATGGLTVLRLGRPVSSDEVIAAIAEDRAAR